MFDAKCKKTVKKKRSSKHAFFETLSQKGHFLRGQYVNVWVLNQETAVPSESRLKQELGIVVSRKTQAHATKRNLWKRRIREVFRLNQALVKPGTLILVKARSIKEIPSTNQIKEDLEKLLR